MLPISLVQCFSKLEMQVHQLIYLCAGPHTFSCLLFPSIHWCIWWLAWGFSPFWSLCDIVFITLISSSPATWSNSRVWIALDLPITVPRAAHCWRETVLFTLSKPEGTGSALCWSNELARVTPMEQLILENIAANSCPNITKGSFPTTSYLTLQLLWKLPSGQDLIVCFLKKYQYMKSSPHSLKWQSASFSFMGTPVSSLSLLCTRNLEAHYF